MNALANIHPKVLTSVVTGALVTILVWVASATGHSMPPEVAAAVVTVLGFLVSWFTPNPPAPVVAPAPVVPPAA